MEAAAGASAGPHAAPPVAGTGLQAVRAKLGVVARGRDELLGHLAALEQREASRLKERAAGCHSVTSVASVATAATAATTATARSKKATKAAATAVAALAVDENAALVSLLSRQAQRVNDRLAAAETMKNRYLEIDEVDDVS